MLTARLSNTVPVQLGEKAVQMGVELPGWISIRFKAEQSTYPMVVCDFEDYSRALKFGERLARKRGCNLINDVPEELRV